MSCTRCVQLVGLLHSSGVPYSLDEKDREQPRRSWDLDLSFDLQENCEHLNGFGGEQVVSPRGALARLSYDERG